MSFNSFWIKIELGKNFLPLTANKLSIPRISDYWFFSPVFLSSNLKAPLSDPLTLINSGSVSPGIPQKVLIEKKNKPFSKKIAFHIIEVVKNQISTRYR